MQKSSIAKKVSVRNLFVFFGSIRWTLASTNSLWYCDILSLVQSLYWKKFIHSQSLNKLSLYCTVLSVHKIYKYFLKLQKLLWCYKYMIFYNNIMTFYFLSMTSIAMIWRYNVVYQYLCPWLRYLDSIWESLKKFYPLLCPSLSPPHPP